MLESRRLEEQEGGDIVRHLAGHLYVSYFVARIMNFHAVGTVAAAVSISDQSKLMIMKMLRRTSLV